MMFVFLAVLAAMVIMWGVPVLAVITTVYAFSPSFLSLHSHLFLGCFVAWFWIVVASGIGVFLQMNGGSDDYF